MTIEKFQKIKPQLLEAFEKAFLKCEAENPGFLKAWFQAWSKGPTP